MNTAAKLQAILDVIQVDAGNRGLRTDPNTNLITATTGDFAAACRGLAETSRACAWVVTGFFIPTGQPPAGETDGPLGALFLARTLPLLGVDVLLFTDTYCTSALAAGLSAAGLAERVGLITLPAPDHPACVSRETYWTEVSTEALRRWKGGLGSVPHDPPLSPLHLIALERAGPTATGQCHTMRGRDITAMTSPAHHLFDAARERGIATIGIGDGGNEIGMGRIDPEVIRRNIPNGGQVACRVPVDHLVVAGVSNWGAYALAVGVAMLKGQPLDASLFEVERERELLRVMVEAGPLVDGVTGRSTVSVDGLAFEAYAEPLRQLAKALD